MRSMPTKSLALRRCADGYYRTSWTDDAGKVHRRSFGQDKNRARNRFAEFNVRWAKDRATRHGETTGGKTLREVYKLFQTHAAGHYVREDGRPTGEAATIDQAMAVPLELFGDAPLEAFDLEALKASRAAMIAKDWCVNTINARVRKVRHVFKWFVENAGFNATAWHAMQALQALAANRAVLIGDKSVKVRVTKPVQPVPEAYVEAVLDHLPLTISTMARVEMLTGARPSELCIMRPVDIDTRGPVWLYTPTHHKTKHRGKSRVIAIGPQAQAALRPLLEGRRVDAYVFSPREAWEQRMAKRREQYQPKPGQGDYRRWKSNAAREREPRGGEMFDRTTYARAIARACKDLDVPHWSPNRLRHNAGTNARRHFGLEAAKAVLGHSSIKTTEIYAEADVAASTQAMLKIG